MAWYSDVFDILFAGLDRKAGNDLWKKELTDSSSEKKNGVQEEED